jgi:hypothetical protein
LSYATNREQRLQPFIQDHSKLTQHLDQANVMLSYPIPEAEELLSNKLSAAQQSLSNCEEDLDFLREQVTVRSLAPLETLVHGPLSHGRH